MGAAMCTLGAPAANAIELLETPTVKRRVDAGSLPPVAERVPSEPSVVHFAKGVEPGIHGGRLRMVVGRSKDIRLMAVYGYARLVGYDRSYRLVPDILKDLKVEDGRIFTLKLRAGHRWSDGHPFTAEAFRYYWQDLAMNKVISPLGPPSALLVDGKPPKFEVIDDTTVRFSWHKPNPFFLPALARPNPLLIYRPAHYLKQFHANYVAKDKLDALVKQTRKRDWRALHYSKDRGYRCDNPDMPTLQPWHNTTRPPSDRYIFVRNNFYHRIDERGHQLPYIDRVVVNISSSKLIPAKTGAGEVSLQARGLSFKNYTFLKQNEKRNNYKVLLWKSGKASRYALYPNLNTKDPVWRALVRKADFRRALSLAIDRNQINQVLFYGLAKPGNNTVLAESPLFKPEYRTKWARYDLAKANALLDGLGLDKRDSDGFRLLPEGRRLEVIIETAGEGTEETDVLVMIRKTWKKAGIKLFIKPSRREVLRRRAKAGETVISLFYGYDNGIASAATAPKEFVPHDTDQLQWPLFGQYVLTRGQSGLKPDMPKVARLSELYEAWVDATSDAAREKIWREVLAIHADQQFSIGIVAGVPQPIVISDSLRNVPKTGVFNWDPGAQFGLYRPDTFWFKFESKT